jgi:N-acetylglucosaminyldiphosphoundecaprenol N-acetyl-beta-D-mannosaminyltransferase
MQTFRLNSVYIHSFSISELKEKFRETLIANNDPQIITTFNLDFLRISQNNEEFLQICKNSLWNLPDGFGIRSLINLKYNKKVERITGNDIFPLLLKIANEKNLKVSIVGSKMEVLDKVQLLVKNKYPNLTNNLKCLSPPPFFERDKMINQNTINEIARFNPDIVFAALGCPRQEIWLYKNMDLFGSKLNIGIGAVLDYYSGKKRRSPVILQKYGMEWLWRLLNEPRRLFRRYVLLDLPFYLKVAINLFIKKNYE